MSRAVSPSKCKISSNYVEIFSSYLAVNTLPLGYKLRQLMLYREIIAVCSEIHTKHINKLCGQKVEFVKNESVSCDPKNVAVWTLIQMKVFTASYAQNSPKSPHFQTVSIVSDAVLILNILFLFLTAFPHRDGTNGNIFFLYQIDRNPASGKD
jgi:hypothetical protein